MNQNQESVLFKTSAASDVQCSGGILTVAGLSGTKKARIASITQVKYKAEVVQVITVGGTDYTVAASTKYGVYLGDPNRTRNGQSEQLKLYSVMSLSNLTDMGATNNLRKEWVTGQLVTAINNDLRNYVAALTAGSGNGFTVTDDAGYYPPFSQTGFARKGASQVKIATNSDGSGYASTNISTTTAAVYSSGVGADLAASVPVIDAMYGGLLSGYFGSSLDGFSFKTKSTTSASNNLPAVSGQNYDIFIIVSLAEAAAHNQRGQIALVPKVQAIAVDNGTGTATTNLAGFVAFEREMLRHTFDLYSTDPSAIFEMFDSPLIASSTYPTTGAAVTTTDNVVMAVTGSYGYTWYVNPIGTHTLITPLVTTGGLTPYLDVTTQEGIEFSPCNLTQCPKEYIVGKSEMSFYARVTFGAIAATDWKSLSVGFRKKAAYAVDQTAYEAASVATACLGVPLDTGAAPVINIITGPGSAGALTNTSTVVSPTAGTSHEFFVTVDINGVAKFYVNGANKTSLLAATYTFTAGLHLMPFISFRHGANTSAAPAIVQTAALPSLTWRA